MKNSIEINRKYWDARTPSHLTSDFYDVNAFKNGANSLSVIELEGLPDVAGKSLLHLQCHFGQDTLNWARLGAKVTGIDLCGAAITEAGRLRDEMGLEAEFIQSDVYDLPSQLGGQFDIVFTSYGSLCWLPDLNRWADVADHFLRPGGTVLIAEFHPLIYMLDWKTGGIAYPYFNRGPIHEVTQGGYVDQQGSAEYEEVFWLHPLSDVVTPMVGRGWKLEQFREYDFSPWPCFENLQKRADREYIYDVNDVTIPLVYSLKFQKPPRQD
jgi:SAM-dependent methyltransferase